MKIKDFIIKVEEESEDYYYLSDLCLKNEYLLQCIVNLLDEQTDSIEDIKNWNGVFADSNYWLYTSEYKKLLPILKKYIRDSKFNNKFSEIIK